jgi:hypothetical protein
MSERKFPVHPNLEQLRHQAKDLLRDIHRKDPAAVEMLRKYHPEPIEPEEARLADAQLVLARSYSLPSWLRLVLAYRMTNAICRNDVSIVRELVSKYPRLLYENAKGTKSNWGPPMSYAANLGRNEIISMLHEMGAADLQHAFDRACLQGELETARLLHSIGARPAIDSVMGPTETLNGDGLAFLLDLGAEISDRDGDRMAPVALVLETYSRHPRGKHECLEILAQHGIELPDTPPMAVHRGRVDLLERHLQRDPGLLTRTFSHEEIWPPELGCHTDHSLALHGTPLSGATLLHMCMDYAEMEIAKWLLERGMDVDVKTEVDTEGFGGHTALFGTVVTYGMRDGDTFARLLLDHGADPNARASLKKRFRLVGNEAMHEYRDVTPLAWGRRLHEQDFVCKPAMRLIARRGGRE